VDRPSTGDIGAASELLVAADLMAKGFRVFRNLSPNGPVDLLANCGSGRIFRIQVKTADTACKNFDEKIKNDVLAQVIDGRVRYLMLNQNIPVTLFGGVEQSARAYQPGAARPRCAGRSAWGFGTRPCQRFADMPGGLCWQHQACSVADSLGGRLARDS